MFRDGPADGGAAAVEAARKAREERAAAKQAEATLQQHTAAVLILQRNIRPWLARRRVAERRREILDIALAADVPQDQLRLHLYQQIEVLRRVYIAAHDHRRVITAVQRLASAMPPRMPPAQSYFALCLDKSLLSTWLQQAAWLCAAIGRALSTLALRKEDVSDATVLLNVLHAILEPSRWQLIDAADPRAKAFILFAQSIANQAFAQDLGPSLRTWLQKMVTHRKLGCSPAALGAAMTVLHRLCSAMAWKDACCTLWWDVLATCPGLFHMIQQHAPLVRETLQRDASFLRTLLSYGCDHLIKPDRLPALSANAALFALANIVDLTLPLTESDKSAEQLLAIVLALLHHLKAFVRQRHKGSTVSSEHPLLGWCAGTTSRDEVDAMPNVLAQLRKWWSITTIQQLFSPLWQETDRLLARNESPDDSGASGRAVGATSASPAAAAAAATTGTLKRSSKGMSRFLRFFSSKPKAEDFVNARIVVSVIPVATSYEMLENLLASAKAEITGSLAFLPELVPRLWTFMHHVGPVGGMQLFVDALGKLDREPLVPMLSLTCSLTTHLLTVVHDDEIIERNDPFSPSQLLQITAFLNRFLARWLWDFGGSEGADPKSPTGKISAGRPEGSGSEGGLQQEKLLLKSAARLLKRVLDIDARRPFVPEGHWKLKELSSQSLLAEYRQEQRAHGSHAAANGAGGSGSSSSSSSSTATGRGHRTLLTLPHMVDFHARVGLLRQEAEDDRAAVIAHLGEVRARPFVRIRRSAILTDGYRELMPYPVIQLKDAIRIVFVNEQGLDEAGIDETGLFKEFLELTLKQGVDPALGLFRQGEDNRLYPSPASGSHQPDHLRLFEYLGRMFGKMVYEGYVVDLPFAQFFLNQLMGRRNTIDDLPSLDAGVARNLAMVRDYPGDVRDLGLYFAVDDEVLGQHISTPLRPGGADMEVTNDNRLLYVHMVADYLLNTRMEAQVKAFLQGFRALVPQRWLQLFNGRELARLTGGDDVPLDVDDLRRHAVYADGYHPAHKVVRWLWDVVAEDLTQQEQEKFLRFVTSCSKPPVLGFKTLRPAFTVRCMAEGAAEDSYTLGGAVLNMFRGGQDTGKLPMASTCFNLLKLPPYKSKRVLRERLKYAINSGAGFEMA